MADNTSPSNEGSTKKELNISEVDNIKSIYEKNGWNFEEAYLVCSLTNNVKQNESDNVIEVDDNDAYMINFVNVMNNSEVVVVPVGTINEKNKDKIAEKRDAAKKAKKAQKEKEAQEEAEAEAAKRAENIK